MKQDSLVPSFDAIQECFSDEADLRAEEAWVFMAQSEQKRI